MPHLQRESTCFSARYFYPAACRLVLLLRCRFFCRASLLPLALPDHLAHARFPPNVSAAVFFSTLTNQSPEPYRHVPRTSPTQIHLLRRTALFPGILQTGSAFALPGFCMASLLPLPIPSSTPFPLQIPHAHLHHHASRPHTAMNPAPLRPPPSPQNRQLKSARAFSFHKNRPGACSAFPLAFQALLFTRFPALRATDPGSSPAVPASCEAAPDPARQRFRPPRRTARP